MFYFVRVLIYMDKRDKYNKLIDGLKANNKVLAVFLSGSRVKGLETPESDFDLYIIFDNSVSSTYIKIQQVKLYALYHSLPLDISNKAMQTLQEFEPFAEMGSEFAWDRYNIARAEVVFDKSENTIITSLLQKKSVLSKKEQDEIIHQHAADYLSHTYRSLKSFEKGESLAARLDASEAIMHMLWVLFALHSRVRPFNKYLKWELTRHPIEGFTLSTEHFLKLIDEILQTGSIPAQQEIYKEIERLARKYGYQKYYDAWGGGKLREITERKEQGVTNIFPD